MALNNHFVEKAKKEICCKSFIEDNQVILELSKLSKTFSVVNPRDLSGGHLGGEFQLLNYTIKSPTYIRATNYTNHIYHAGNIRPEKLSLKGDNYNFEDSSWIELKDNNKTDIKIYNDKGLTIPHAQYMYTRFGDLLISILELNRNHLIDYSIDTIFIKFYNTSGYGKVISTTDSSNKIKFYSHPQNIAYITDSKPELLPQIFIYVNGVFVYKINDEETYNNGDVLVAYLNTFIKTKVFMPVSNLRTFVSELDSIDGSSQTGGMSKYLISYDSSDTNEVKYHDDLDIFLCATDPINSDNVLGVYYNKNNVKSIRMVTHRDYSVPVTHLQSLSEDLKDVIRRIRPGSTVPLFQDMFLDIRIKRNDNYIRNLIHESNRLKELYKLDHRTRIDAMVGDNTLDIWRAEKLENSSYTLLLGMKEADITNEIVSSAYGYNAMAKEVNPSYKFITNIPEGTNKNINEAINDNFPLLKNRATNFFQWFSEEQNNRNKNYNYNRTVTKNDAIKMYQSQPFGNDYNNKDYSTPSVVGYNNIPIDTNKEHRVYKVSISFSGKLNNDWANITDSSEYVIQNGILKRTGSNTNFIYLIRYLSNVHFVNNRNTINQDNYFTTTSLSVYSTSTNPLFYKLDISEKVILSEYGFHSATNNYYNNISHSINNGLHTLSLLPYGKYDIHLNGFYLVEGIDYYIEFPNLIIQKYRNQSLDGSSISRIWIIGTGYPDDNNEYKESKDKGFITDSFLSDNNVFNLRDDRSVDLYINGLPKNLNKINTDLNFRENTSARDVVSKYNGKPYSINDNLVILNDFTSTKTIDLLNEAAVIDKKVSDYITSKKSYDEPTIVSTITSRYKLVSYFLQIIIFELKKTNTPLTGSVIGKALNTSDITRLCDPFKPAYLTKDVFLNNDLYDNAYIEIIPFNIFESVDLRSDQYSFLERVIKVYGEGLVDLTKFINVVN